MLFFLNVHCTTFLNTSVWQYLVIIDSKIGVKPLRRVQWRAVKPDVVLYLDGTLLTVYCASIRLWLMIQSNGRNIVLACFFFFIINCINYIFMILAHFVCLWIPLFLHKKSSDSDVFWFTDLFNGYCIWDSLFFWIPHKLLIQTKHLVHPSCSRSHVRVDVAGFAT